MSLRGLAGIFEWGLGRPRADGHVEHFPQGPQSDASGEFSVPCERAPQGLELFSGADRRLSMELMSLGAPSGEQRWSGTRGSARRISNASDRSTTVEGPPAKRPPGTLCRR